MIWNREPKSSVAAIEPFHGQYFRLCKKIDGRFMKVFEHPEASRLAGEPVPRRLPQPTAKKRRPLCTS
jgi:hypothetical protein